MKVFLDQLGCRLNEAEVSLWRRQLRALGHATVSRVEDADVAVLNSCAVTAEAARTSRRRTRALHRMNPRANIVLTGCFATLEPGQAAALAGVDLVVPNSHKDRLVDRIIDHLDTVAAPWAAAEPGAPIHPDAPRTRAFVKIQDGCRNRCSFCIVTKARGEERSRGIKEIVDEISGLHDQGYSEVVLTGVHIGGYGHDRGGSLATLLDAILAQTHIPRIRLGSLEPWDLPDDLFDRWTDRRLLPHLHLPLQSGSDPVLRRMARRCPTARYRRVVGLARAAIPGLHLTTDLIVGFPGSTNEDHARSLEFLAQMGFGDAHVFTYSPRPGTAAARLPGQLSPQTKRARTRQMQAAVALARTRALRSRVGETRPVLFEGTPKQAHDGYRFEGYTDTFQRVAIHLADRRSLRGHVLPIRIDSVEDDRTLRGTPARVLPRMSQP
ncbi:MAG: tRNA (N(6)-L-threonylcarbamoyladenosine(37)-C(2))-methylthiotransferase MtaB [Myxococcota bacterium]|nr:tRNA (N(6)-L-threonylcarbamoyladenosine(37)-C(2))-methylthiotransferase MtaB [Myxococcota bacterium]MEC8425634.1 tRNA (N(6)-L-threonylcarbamoyladenosine(37)-C(2))-methylthiotransferase MtaB [Myxococcota bacterium]